jgi:hypothetical protein
MTARALVLGLLSLAVSLQLAACGDDDGGGGFRPITPPATASGTLIARGVWAFSADDVWFVDGSETIHRFDGQAWSTLAAPRGVSCIFALSASQVWLCGDTEVVHFDGATFSSSDVTTSTGLDGITAIWASSPTDVWVVGDDAIVARSSGSTWTRTLVGSPFKHAIWGSGPSDVYVLDTFELAHFDGSAWTEVERDGSRRGGDGAIWGTGAGDVWVVDGSDSPSHFDGTTWTTTELAIVGDLAAIWGTSSSDIWGVGSFGQIARYSGSRWTSVAAQEIGAPYLQQLVAVHGSSPDDVWIVGHQLGDGGPKGLIYHRSAP